VSLVGGQARIVTDNTYGKARIMKIDVSRIHRELEAGKVVVVAGFQGVTADHEITTLGRGGSDLTAVALAAALKADLCEIYTDVEGVYTADPSTVENARKIDKISYDEMLELASSGAQVMQARSIEFAHNYGVRIHVRAQHGLTTGTIITSEEEVMEQVVYRGVALDKEASKFSILGIPDIPGIAARIFGRLAEHQIVVDMIVQSAARRGYNDITFTVHQDDFEKTLALVDQLVEELEAEGRNYDRDIAKITAVGAGMRTRPGVAATMFKALADADINIDVISTSEMKISCVVKRERGEDGVRAVHRAFGLEGPK
jgi:aspartate kinase